MFLILYRKSIGLLVKLPGRLQRRGDFCLKESIRQPLCLIWLCLKEPDQKGNSHSCPSSCKKSSSIHCHNKRNMTFLFSVEIAALVKIAENSISRLPASLTNLSGSEAKEKIDAEVKYLKFEYLKKKKWIIIQSHSTIEGKECKQHRQKCSLLS